MRRHISEWLQQQWYTLGIWHIVLFPFSILFWILSSCRRWSYTSGIFKSTKLAVPVIVVGNISVGGTGKTPLVIAIAEHLQTCGFHPGIISRGYAGSSRSITRVLADSDPNLVGDEPVLMASRTSFPVWVGRQRAAVGAALLQKHPDCDVIISDDGLQHYQLARDFEIVVLDGLRGLGNSLLLPAGPLREPASRLASVDAVVLNGTNSGISGYSMQTEGALFHKLRDATATITATDLKQKKLHALAGIGNPQKFFLHLESLGLDFEGHVFPDHYLFTEQDLSGFSEGAIIMTEKDAVKCKRFAPENAWYLPIRAVLDESFLLQLTKKLRK